MQKGRNSIGNVLIATGLPVRRNYVPYTVPKKMNFRVETGEYDLNRGGWVTKIEENVIIGETDDCYITRLLKSEGCDSWDKQWYGKKYVLPIGIHKSRLAAIPQGRQLELFN